MPDDFAIRRQVCPHGIDLSIQITWHMEHDHLVATVTHKECWACIGLKADEIIARDKK